jgi:regulator of cell morphogenesis and NO signaling
MSDRFTSVTVGEVVARDFRTAAVFEEFGIDFCCGGRRSFVDACRAAAADPATVERALDSLLPVHTNEDDASGWPIPRLIDHIVTTHHAYIRSALPILARYLAKLVDVHGSRHPELTRVHNYFSTMRRDLEQHMMKEEQVLFVYVRGLAEHVQTSGQMNSPFGTVANPIRMMEREHQQAADELRLIRELTSGYMVPEDGCATYSVCMWELAQFERDLHRHVHLENNILFPRALQLEEQICGRSASL